MTTNKKANPLIIISKIAIIYLKFDIIKLNVYNWYMAQEKKYPYLTSLKLIKLLAENKFRLFSVKEVRQLLSSEGLTVKNLKNTLHYLKVKEYIHLIRKNLYAMDDIYLDKEPIHEFELATRLVKPSALSHFTAFHIHGLTDQFPLKVYATTPLGTKVPQKSLSYQGSSFVYVQTKKEHYFGFDHTWRGNTKIPITDLEKTLLDGLTKPKYCGGMREVIHAYKVSDFDLTKLITYALRLDAAIAKRLGWILEHIGFEHTLLKKLETVPRKGYVKLNPSGKDTGKYNKRWQIRENI